MIRTISETGSTNADLASAVRAGEIVAEGDWIVADRQTTGRGRQGRSWFDGLGNFMGSTLVRLNERDPAPASLALTAALALYETVQPLLSNAADLKLKWPNDLLLGGAKVAGILLEREAQAIVVGIGVNLAIAPDLTDRRTTALSKFGPAPDRDLFANSLVNHFAREVERWRTYGIEPLVRRWETVAHPPGSELVVNTPGEEQIRGTFAGLTETGALRLRLSSGDERIIHAGDVMLASEES
ncbi:biotin--[acetyl-CoA-carboxylase] ligase [Qipengyuania sp. NPDC077563]|uniref:biotin--[acetyl-CoA-carboxylase] ligase n=1 Tax=Qipengyuania sp. NPDC077563 TaxID=3364497 RepID=UPI0038514B74